MTQNSIAEAPKAREMRVTVQILMPTALAKKLKTFCKRVSLTQPQVIRTLVFNLLTTYYPSQTEERTALIRSARMQQRHWENYERGTVLVGAVLSTRQCERLDTVADGIGLDRSDVVRILIRNFIATTKPGRAEDAFLQTARHLTARLPSSPLWGNGCERDADSRLDQAIAFIKEHPGLSVGKVASAFRGLGLRHSREWIQDAQEEVREG